MKEAEGYSSVVALAEEHFEEGLGKPARLSFSCSLDLLLNASDIDQTNINRDIRDGNWLSKIWSFLGKKSFKTGEIKSFVTHITENPPRHLVHIVFWSGIGQKVQKMAIFGPK